MSKLSIKKNDFGGHDIKIDDVKASELGLLITSITIDMSAGDVPTATINVAFPRGVELEDDDMYIEVRGCGDDV
jgi:hypothetical protein